MKLAAAIAGVLLGLLFLASSVPILFGLVQPPPPPEGTPLAAFFAAFGPTGYLAFIKVCELVGGLLVAVPRTRNLGLLVLGPIVVNIVAFHVFITRAGFENPLFIGAVVLSAFLLWCERRAFAALVTR